MITLETLAAPPQDRNTSDSADAMMLTKDELLATLAAVVIFERGEKTLLRKKRKADLVELVARAVAYTRQANQTKRRAPRPRKPVRTRAERHALGSRVQRRMYTKSRNARTVSRIS